MSSAPAVTRVFGEETLHPFALDNAVIAIICKDSPQFFQNFVRDCGWEIISLSDHKKSNVRKILRGANALIGWATHDIGQIFTHLCAEAEIPNRPVLIAVGYEASSQVDNPDFFAYPDSQQIRQTLTSALKMHAGFLKSMQQASEQQIQLESYRQHESEQLPAVRELALFKEVIGSKLAHELRTPMLQVGSAINALVQADESPIPRATLINYALQAAHRLERVIQDITLHAEGLEVRVQPMVAVSPVDAALRTASRRVNTALSEERLQFNLKDSSYIVSGDWRGLGIALHHLMDNALKFSDENAPVLVSVYQSSGQVYYVVEDHGIGISKEAIEYICNPYYQVEFKDDRRYDGTGLGLALAKMILDKHNAPLVITSEPDIGSTFSFSLPLANLE